MALIFKKKTTKSNTYFQYANYKLSNLDVLFSFYKYHTSIDKFNLYQRRQRVLEIMVNMLLHELCRDATENIVMMLKQGRSY
ncbi:uncharacterized protein BX663DRAFT_504088 [Cokeromyces recurvatus]|uniref:uncharacterized protein n=1 Tax=Cokeromyces recurvatus TaxID=90255 RepID=UPI00221EAB43|nr:uncharacterized protein BX663DRAFT_504088 [Cokeromyces recurvatus]KAI7904138.1 hypothetical protein BX663DRAFT_504088 [Cokeromyces recurvatus]